MSRRRLAAVLVPLLLVAGSCGIPLGGGPEVLPGGVVTPALTAPAEPGSEVEPASRVTIFLVREGHLEPVTRSTPAARLGAAVRSLLEGPTAAEVVAGYRTAITPSTALRSAAVGGTTGVLDLSSELVEIGGQEQILAIAQLVLTATAVPGVERVRFLLEGREVEVPKPDGTLASGALSLSDYEVMRSPGPG